MTNFAQFSYHISDYESYRPDSMNSHATDNSLTKQGNQQENQSNPAGNWK